MAGKAAFDPLKTKGATFRLRLGLLVKWLTLRLDEESDGRSFLVVDIDIDKGWDARDMDILFG